MGRGGEIEVGGRRAHTRAEEESERAGRRARAGSRWRPNWGRAPAVGQGRSGLPGEGLAVRHADAGERREDACEPGVACTVAPLTSGSRAAGGSAEATGREKGLVL